MRQLPIWLVALAAGAWLSCAPTPEPPPAQPGVLVIMCDTLRADHLGLYGHEAPTSPFLDELAERAWVVDRAYSHFSYTWPTIASLFTGRPFSELSAEQLFVKPEKFETPGLVADNETLAERLEAAGIATAAVSANPYVSTKTGYAQGFGTFHDAFAWDADFWRHVRKFRVDDVNAVALDQLDELLRTGRPWFHYVHYFDPHMPYRPPWADAAPFVDDDYDREGRFVKGYFRKPNGKNLKFLTPDFQDWVAPEDVEHMVDHYEGEIRHLDAGLRRFFAELDQRGVLESSTIILTGDHGEGFFERGFWGHGFASRDEEERVPLLVLTPDGEPRRLSGPASTTDIYHSVLDHFGLDVGPASTWSMDLMRGESRRPVAYSEGPDATRIFRDGRYSLYRYVRTAKRPVPLPDRDMLFDTETDPGEKVDLFASDPERAAEIRSRLLEGFPATLTERGKPTRREALEEVDDATRERLRALGYVE